MVPVPSSAVTPAASIDGNLTPAVGSKDALTSCDRAPTSGHVQNNMDRQVLPWEDVCLSWVSLKPRGSGFRVRGSGPISGSEEDRLNPSLELQSMSFKNRRMDRLFSGYRSRKQVIPPP